MLTFKNSTDPKKKKKKNRCYFPEERKIKQKPSKKYTSEENKSIKNSTPFAELQVSTHGSLISTTQNL